MLNLSACGWKWPEWATIDSDPFGFISEEDSNTPPPPKVIPRDEPDQNDAASRFVPTSTMGLNLETYFVQDIQDPMTRIQRLENAVIAMHKDLQNVTGVTPPEIQPTVETAPTWTNTSGLQVTAPTPVQTAPTLTNPGGVPQSTTATGSPQPLTKTETTITQPSASNYNAIQPAPVASAIPTAQPGTGKPVTPGPRDAAGFSNGNIFATGIRVGEHSDKVRVVFDVTKKTRYSADLDNSENILVFELPEAAWQAPDQAKFPKMALLDSYKVDPFNGGAGSIAVLQLKKGSRILKQQQIRALSGPGYRIFIDLAK